MAQNTLAPYWSVLEYIVDNEPHSQSWSCAVDNDALGLSSYDLVLRDGVSTVDYSTYMLTYSTLFAVNFRADATGFVQATLYRQLPTDVDPVILEVAVVNPTWTVSAPVVKASQISWNFYGQQRSRLRLTALDGVIQPFKRESYAQLSTSGQPFIDHVLGPDCPIQTRAGEYIASFGQRTVTYNDKLTQKYYNVK